MVNNSPNAQSDEFNANMPYGMMANAAIAIEGGTIAWIGHDQNIPDAYHHLDKVDLDGRVVTPALIDCHTHIVHGSHPAKSRHPSQRGYIAY